LPGDCKKVDLMSKILKALKKSSAGNLEDLVSRLKNADHIRLLPPPHESQLHEFEHLVNTLIGMHHGGDGLVVVFSSASSGEGTSFVSYNVARQLHVMMDHPIAWVDGNFLSPQKKLQDPEFNFRNLLSNPRIWKDFPISPNLTLIPNGSRRIKPLNLLKGDNYKNVLSSFQKSFYFTIIDAPPFLDSVDVAHLASRAFGMIAVIESRGLKYEIIQTGLNDLASHNVNILGTVLNKRIYDIPQKIYKRL